jgi:hypothetical protein
LTYSSPELSDEPANVIPKDQQGLRLSMAESQGVFTHDQLQIASIYMVAQGIIKRVKLGNL